MILNRFRIQNYRRFTDLSLNFSKGINVISGKNEAGKSTIASALLDCLFTDPATRAKGFYDSARAWSGNSAMSLELEFEAGVTKYLLQKDFLNRTVKLVNLDSGKQTDSLHSVNSLLAKLMHIPTRQVFESTAFISQAEVARIETDNDFVEAVHNVVGSTEGNVNIQSVLSGIDEEVKKLRVGLDHPAKNPGPVKLAEDSVHVLQADLADKRARFAKTSEAFSAEKESGTKLQEITVKISETEELINNHKKNEEASKKLNELDLQITQIEATLKNIKELLDQRSKVEITTRQFSSFASVDTGKLTQELTKLSEEQELLTKQLQQAAQAAQQPTRKEQPAVSRQPYYLAAIIIAILAVILALATSQPLIAALGILIGISVLITGYRRKPSPQQQDTTSEAVVGQAQLQQLSAVRSKLAEELRPFGVSTLNEFFTRKAQYQAVRENLKEIDAELKGLVAGKSIKDIETEQIRLLKEKKQIEVTELTEAVRQSKLSPEQYLRKRRELDMLYLEKQRLDQQQTASKVRAEESDVSIDDITSLEEKLELAMMHITQLERRQNMLALVKTGLQEAIERTARSAKDIVSKQLEEFLPVLTENRYKNARLTSQLEVEVFSDEKNAWVSPVGALSNGTVDQIYFLTRIAFLRIILSDQSLPIILDDPFVTFDKDRLTLTHKILNGLSEKYQIILFTHSPEYDTWGRLMKLSTHQG